MGTYCVQTGGAEVCAIVGLFILCRLDQLNNDIKAVFSQLGLDITIQTGLQTVNHLLALE